MTGHVGTLPAAIASTARVFIVCLLVYSSSWSHLIGIVDCVTLVAGGGVAHPAHYTVRVSTFTGEGAHAHSVLISSLACSL